MPAGLWLLRHAESEGNRADTTAQGSGAERLELDRDERLRQRDLGMLHGFTKQGIERRFP